MDRYRKLILIMMLPVICVAQDKPVITADVVSSVKTNVFVVKGKAVTDYVASGPSSWRFLHDGEKVIGDFLFTGGHTFTPFKVVQCKTALVLSNEIAKLKLKLTESQSNDLIRIIEAELPQNDLGK